MPKPKNVTDKDMLFSKILPALNDNPFSATHIPQDEPTLPEEPQTRSRLLPSMSDSQDSLSLLRSQLFARSGAIMPDTFATINIMEGLVLTHMDPVIEKFNICRCDRCRCDIAACALNHLPPKYVVANPSRLTQLKNSADAKRVIAALVKAALQVRSHPRH